MLRRLYVHNFRCLENFELALGTSRSVLLIGRNGSGKTTIGLALEILQRIGRGTSRVGELVRPKDLTLGRKGLPARFELEVELHGKNYLYTLAFELPAGFRELRVQEENLSVDGTRVLSRDSANVRYGKARQSSGAAFGIDWHLVALPVVQEQSTEDSIYIFRQWLASILILRPVPYLTRGDADRETLLPDPQVTNVGAWFSGMVTSTPAAYARISDYLSGVMPDFKEMTNPLVGNETRSLLLRFQEPPQTVEFTIEDLSDGERCFVIFALAIAANKANGPLLCFWDEPNNFLAPSEVGASIMALRSAFRDAGQLIVASHNPEAIRRFSDDNTMVLYRNGHLEPTRLQSVEALRSSGQFEGGVIDAILRGDVAA